METRKVGTGNVVNYTSLQAIPTARDPWVVMSAVPGVLVDRVNVGGNQSGQQSNFVGKGSNAAQGVFSLDGVMITDTGAQGSSPAYYDFDSFEEIQLGTGGTDLSASTPGVQINLVTKRGTNEVHGSARMFLTQDRWQSQNLPAAAAAQGTKGGNRIDEVQDYGVEVGGPLWKDRAWMWGSYGRQEIHLLTITGSKDNTTLEGTNGKLNIQFLEGTAGTVFYSRDDKLKFGRGAGTTRPPETAYNQTGPATIYKGELSEVFSSQLFATGSYAYVGGGFGLTPAAGTSVDFYRDAGLVFHNSYYFYKTVRPQHAIVANSSYFFNTGQMGHELKFGFQYRNTPVTSTSGASGPTSSVGYFDTTGDYAELDRTATSNVQVQFYNGFLSDTLTAGNLTLNAGVRYDVARGRPGTGVVAANPVIPDILPGYTFSGGAQQFEWKNWEPRVGITYAVGSQRKLLVKASYSRFVDQLTTGPLFQTNAIPGSSYLEYYWKDSNNDKKVQRDELDFSRGLHGFGSLNPTNPTSTAVFNQVDPNLKAPKTDEFIVGADYEVMPDLVVGANYTYRKYNDAIFPANPRIGLARSDYVLLTSLIGTPNAPSAATLALLKGTLANGQTYDLSNQVYRLAPGKSVGSGSIVENRPAYDQKYSGLELTLNKRLSNKWMARGSFAYNDWKQSNGLDGCVDPNNQITNGVGATCPGNDIIARRSAGSGDFADVFINAKWQFNVAGLYELPLGFSVAANVFGRQGYPYPNWVVINPGDGLGNRTILVGKLDDRRHENVYNADLRLGKVINVTPISVTLSLDIFNVLNESAILQRSGRINSSLYNTITEVQAPRVVRAGARIGF